MAAAWLLTQPRSMDCGKPSFQVIFEKQTSVSVLHAPRSLAEVSKLKFQQSSESVSPESLYSFEVQV